MTWTQAWIIIIPLMIFNLFNYIVWRREKKKFNERDRKYREEQRQRDERQAQYMQKIIDDRREKIPGIREVKRDRFEMN